MSELTRTKVKDLLKAAPGIEVLAKGWVRTKRGNKQIKFIALNDGSTVHNIQVVADMANFDESLIAKVTTSRSKVCWWSLSAAVRLLKSRHRRLRFWESATRLGIPSRKRTLPWNISAPWPTCAPGPTHSERF